MLKKANRAFFNITLICAIAQKTEGFRAIALQAAEKHRVIQQPAKYRHEFVSSRRQYFDMVLFVEFVN
jgi:hypothetical protein